jgi:hypothetical protein
MEMRTGRYALAAAVLLGGLAAASFLGRDGDGEGGGTGTGSTEPGATTACPARAGERPAKRVLRCAEPSVAFVETDAGTGTGVVVELRGRRYLLTNQHVVDPFDGADVTVGDVSFPDLPVVGVDIGADIALLGPLTGRSLPEPLAVTDGRDLERGDDVFLVGFPGESNDDDLETTIASGIVSRTRSVKEFDQVYIQTDATIAGGQSGGPLFDGEADLVGISGLSFAESQFALVLSGTDVRAAMERIVDGDGDEYLALPGAPGRGPVTASGSLRIYDGSDGQVLYLPAAGQSRTWNLTVDMAARTVVSVHSFVDDEVLAESSNTEEVYSEIDRQLAAARGGRPDDLESPGARGRDPKVAEREVGPGRFTIPVKADEGALVFVSVPLTDGPIEVAWQSDLPLVAASRPVTERTAGLGEDVDIVLGFMDTSVDVLVELNAGQRVEAHARSPQGDPGFVVFPAGVKLDHLTMADPESAGADFYDDTDDGLYGYDARATIEAETAGTYRFRVYSNEEVSIPVRFSVVDCADADCDDTETKERD